MSFNLFIWHPEPGQEKIDPAQIYQNMMDGRIKTTGQRKLRAFFDQILSEYPDAPVEEYADYLAFTLRGSDGFDLATMIVYYAVENGLVCYDPQDNELISKEEDSPKTFEQARRYLEGAAKGIEIPTNNRWLTPHLSSSLKPLGFKLKDAKFGFFEFVDSYKCKATLSLGAIGTEVIFLSGPSVILENQTIFDFLNDLHKKGCRSYSGSFFSRQLPQFDENMNVKWAFKFNEDEHNRTVLNDLINYLKLEIVPLINRWGTYRLTSEDIDLLRNEYDAEYSLVVNLYLGGQKVEAENLAQEYLDKTQDKEIYQKFIRELFDRKPRALLPGSSS